MAIQFFTMMEHSMSDTYYSSLMSKRLLNN
jgi:hypothetical protein